jgi:quercetin dioxygenase-like cupin family protein
MIASTQNGPEKSRRIGMKARHVLAFAVCFAITGAVLGQAAKIMTPSDQQWAEIDPATPGSKIVDLWGDHTKGAFGALFKFQPGFSVPLHTHTSPMKLIVLQGTVIHGPEGKPEVRLVPGSYLLQPGATYKHTTACDKASECEIFVEGTGKFDLVPAAK